MAANFAPVESSLIVTRQNARTARQDVPGWTAWGPMRTLAPAVRAPRADLQPQAQRSAVTANQERHPTTKSRRARPAIQAKRLRVRRKTRMATKLASHARHAAQVRTLTQQEPLV